MEIATGYFAKAKTYAAMGYALVSIAKVAPWFVAKELTLYDCDELKPTDDILALKDSPIEYEKKYRLDVLSKVTPMKVFNRLYLIARQEFSSKVALLCYESPGKFCHRHIVANWLTENLVQKVEEIDCQAPEKRQPSLFDSDVF